MSNRWDGRSRENPNGNVSNAKRHVEALTLPDGNRVNGRPFGNGSLRVGRIHVANPMKNEFTFVPREIPMPMPSMKPCQLKREDLVVPSVTHLNHCKIIYVSVKMMNHSLVV